MIVKRAGRKVDASLALKVTITKVLVRHISVAPAKTGPKMFSLAGLVSGSQSNSGTNRVTIWLIRRK